MNDNTPVTLDARLLSTWQVNLILSHYEALLAGLFASNSALIAKLAGLEGTTDRHIDTLGDWTALQQCLLARHRLEVETAVAGTTN